MDIAVILVFAVVYFFISKSPYEKIIDSSGITLIIGGAYSVLHSALYNIDLHSDITIPTFIQNVAKNYDYNIYFNLCYIFCIVVGVMIIKKTIKVKEKMNVYFIILAFIFAVSSIALSFYSLSYSTGMVILATGSLFIATVKKQIIINQAKYN